MTCVTTCLIGCVLISGMIMCMITSHTSIVFKKFKKLLDKPQLEIYKKIHNERLAIYIQGMILGLLSAVLLVHLLNLKNMSKICTFIVITLLINIVYYQLYPKTTYMLQHLTTQDQVDAWLEIYKEMKLKKIVGMIAGTIGYFLIAKNAL